MEEKGGKRFWSIKKVEERIQRRKYSFIFGARPEPSFSVI